MRAEIGPGAGMTPRDRATEPLRRELTAWGLWLLMVNGMIGAGIFGVPAQAQRLAGDFSPWVFVLGALLIAPVMLCFAQLASRFSGTGGPALYVAHAFGPFAGFQAGWAFYVARLTAFAANLNLLMTTIGYLLPAANGALTRHLLLGAMTAAMIWVNVVGARIAMRSLGTLTVAKLLPLAAMATAGLWALDGDAVAAVRDVPPGADLASAVLLVIYAYVGFESGLVPAGEAKAPRRDMPRALLWALATATALYALIQLGAQSLLPDLAQSERPLVDAGAQWLGPIGAVLVLVGIVASVGGNLVGSMFSTARVSYRLALDGQLPAWFARVHPRYATPANSVIAYGLAAAVLAMTGSFVWLAVMSVFVRLLIYLACIAAMPAAARLDDTSGSGFRLGSRSLAPALGVLVCLGLASQVSLTSMLSTAALLVVGSLLYLLARRKA
jgi:amino acid transporter